MGLRCLFGHEFGDPEVEREREESENEVVVTVREVKVCERCGDRRVVSENTEVTAVRTPDEVGLDEESEDDEEPTHPTVDDDVEEEFEPPADPAEDDGEILDEDVERGHGEWPQTDDPRVEREAAEEPATAEAATDDADADDRGDAPKSDPAAEGAEIIDGDDDGGQQPWPDSSNGDAEDSDAADDSPRAWPEHEGDDEGFSAQADDGERADVSLGGGLAPVADEEKKQYVGHQADDGDVEEMARADATAAVERGSGVDTEYYCPNCGHASSSDGSSMRPGDICPECHSGYIAERER